MQPKPENFNTYYAEAFKDKHVVEAYRYRPPYPQEVFAILASLVIDEPRAVLDVGSGSGDIARPFVELVEWIDAVDFSQSMIEQGKQLPNGNHPQLHWIYGKVEEVPLAPPYALITAGSSIHWPVWEIAFPRFQRMLTTNGSLALIYRRTLPMPWETDLRKVLAQFSDRHRQGHRGSNAIKELEVRDFFRRQGTKETAPIPFVQSLDDYIEGLHSRSGFSRERMGRKRRLTLTDKYERSYYSFIQMASFHYRLWLRLRGGSLKVGILCDQSNCALSRWEHDRGKPCHYYTDQNGVALPRKSVYSSDRACPCHALQRPVLDF